jgi:diacylglycerol kinase family enzyme
VDSIKPLRNIYKQKQRQLDNSSGKAARFKYPVLIINPKSGNGRAINAHIAQLAQRQKIQPIIIKGEDDIEIVARQAVASGADALGISSGDGSIGAVAKVAIEYNLPIVVLPGGTRCHFARDLGLNINRIGDGLAGFSGKERRIDVGNINGRIFLNNTSIGLYADIVSHPEYREDKFDVSRKVLRSIVNGKKKLYDLQFRYGQTKFKEALQVLVGVNCYNTVNIFELGHREQLDGGVLQVTAVTKINNDVVKKILNPLIIDKLHILSNQDAFQQWETHSFRIKNSTDSLELGVDGEYEVYDNPVTVRIMPKALRIYVPV